MHRLIFCLLICLTVVSCGTKGDLYIPERQYPQPAQSDSAS